MKAPECRLIQVEKNAAELAHALRFLLESLKMDEDTRTRFEAVTGAQKALIGHKKMNPGFKL